MATSKGTSVYLVSRTFEAMRPKEAVSARINMIVDRYLELVDYEAKFVRGEFNDAQWATLLEIWSKTMAGNKQQPLPAVAARTTIIRALQDPALAEKVKELTSGDLFVAIELLEREVISRQLEVASAGEAA